MTQIQSGVAGYLSKTNIKAMLFDGFALAFIYFLPAISHMLSLPLYMIEPMRLMLIFALVHTRRENAYILAITLPLFSYFISAHPIFVKALLMTIELTVMVFVFYILVRRIHTLAAIFASIWISKGLYYGMKYLAIMTVMPSEPVIGIPLLLQLLTSIIFSVYLFLMFKKS